MRPDDLLDCVREHDAEYVDLRCVTWTDGAQHRIVTVACLSPDELTVGIPHDGGCRLRPSTATAHLDPFAQFPTLAVMCDLIDASGASAAACSRAIASRAAKLLAGDDGAEAPKVTAQLEFYIFDQVSFAAGGHAAHFAVDAREGAWRRGQPEPDNHGLQINANQGVHATPPADTLVNMRSEIATVLASSGVGVRGHRHGPGGPGHVAIELDGLPLAAAADAIMTARHVTRNVAARHGKVATFMPRPLGNDAGSHLSFTIELGGWSEAVEAVRGRAAALAALLWPTTNSYRGVGAEGRPVITVGEQSLEASVDPSGDPHVALGALAICMAARDDVAAPPSATLAEALDHLATHRGLLETGGVFPAEFGAEWDRRRRAECAQVAACPHPAEYELYFAR